MQPGSRIGGVRPVLAMEIHEDLLCHVLRLMPIRQHAVCDRDDPRILAQEQLLETGSWLRLFWLCHGEDAFDVHRLSSTAAAPLCDRNVTGLTPLRSGSAGQGHSQREHGASAVSRFGVDVASQAAGKLAGKVEAETGSTDGAGFGSDQAAEACEKTVHVPACDADSAVAHAHLGNRLQPPDFAE